MCVGVLCCVRLSRLFMACVGVLLAMSVTRKSGLECVNAL